MTSPRGPAGAQGTHTWVLLEYGPAQNPRSVTVKLCKPEGIRVFTGCLDPSTGIISCIQAAR